MTVTVLQLAPTRRLTRVERVVRELDATADQSLISDLIDAATAAIERVTRRPEGFGRESIVETVRGYGGSELQLARTPVVQVTSLTRDGEPVLDWSIGSRDEGMLYRRVGWEWTVGAVAGIGGRRRGWPQFEGVPVAGSEDPAYAVSYVAGYLLPEQGLLGVATLDASADNSFGSADGALPALLRPGDVIVTAGFETPANNGRHLVTAVNGAGAAMRVQVAEALASEAAGGMRSLTFEGLITCRSIADVERAAIETVKAAFLGETDVVEQQIGATRTRRSEGGAPLALPAVAMALLAPWVRSA